MNSEVMQNPQLSIGRLLLLGVSSVILCVGIFTSLFAPFPLALAIILYGRMKGLLLGLSGLALTFVLAHPSLYGNFTLFGIYVTVFIFGVAIAEIVLRGISPMKGAVGFGLGFIVLLASMLGLIIKSTGMSVDQFIVHQVKEVYESRSEEIKAQKEILASTSGTESFEMLEMLDKPELAAQKIKDFFPSAFFMGVFLMLWFNMYLALKSRRLLMSGQEFPYSEKNLLNFKVPFPFIFVLVAALVLAIWGSDLGLASYETVGYLIIKCLGVFYFFQGFGVLNDLLTFLGVMGFFRTIIVVMIVILANYMVAAAGLFDNWFDFRKYFVKRNKEE